ncbi:hypothetical protein J6590_044738 [Homalodisca vitripennis]|nr:hypothetical protein J6590_044738 [Homalodisca vitripennis]
MLFSENHFNSKHGAKLTRAISHLFAEDYIKDELSRRRERERKRRDLFLISVFIIERGYGIPGEGEGVAGDDEGVENMAPKKKRASEGETRYEFQRRSRPMFLEFFLLLLYFPKEEKNPLPFPFFRRTHAKERATTESTWTDEVLSRSLGDAALKTHRYWSAARFHWLLLRAGGPLAPVEVYGAGVACGSGARSLVKWSERRALIGSERRRVHVDRVCGRSAVSRVGPKPPM